MRQVLFGFVIVAIAAAAISPKPDLGSMLDAGAPIMAVYLVGVALIYIFRKRKKQP